jgi:hypothetical protein
MAPGAASPGFLDAGDRIQGQAVDAARARHHPVEDDDDLPLRRVRQRPVGAEAAAQRSTSCSVMSSSHRSPNGGSRWLRITERGSRIVDGLRFRSSAR